MTSQRRASMRTYTGSQTHSLRLWTGQEKRLLTITTAQELKPSHHRPLSLWTIGPRPRRNYTSTTKWWRVQKTWPCCKEIDGRIPTQTFSMKMLTASRISTLTLVKIWTNITFPINSFQMSTFTTQDMVDFLDSEQRSSWDPKLSQKITGQTSSKKIGKSGDLLL